MTSPADRFIEDVCSEVVASSAIRHPYLEAFASVSLPDFAWAVRDLAYQYGLYNAGFADYVRAVIERLDAPEHKQILEANLAEELGAVDETQLASGMFSEIAGRPHANLYADFQTAVGVEAQYLETASSGPVSGSWREQFLSLCQLNQFVGVGAIGIGTEMIVADIYQQILKGLEGGSALTRRQRVFFTLHSECDEAHAAQMLLIARELAEDLKAREQILYGARSAIALRSAFWDEMLERALSVPAANEQAATYAN